MLWEIRLHLWLWSNPQIPMYLSCACPISQALDATSYGSAQVLVIARGIFQYILYKKRKKKPWTTLQGSAAHQTTLSLFGLQPNLDEKLAESTEAFIRWEACWKHRGFHSGSTPQDTKTNEYHGGAEVLHVLSAAKTQEWVSFINIRQFEATHETRKLPNVYLEKLSRSDSEPTVSSRPWLGARIWLSKTSLYDERSCSL